MSGCSGGPKVYAEPKIDKNLPTPQKIRYLSGVTSIAFEWDKIDNPRVEGFAVYRTDDAGKMMRIGEAPSRFATHYLDMDLQPGQEYSYRIATYSKEGFESVACDPVPIRTKPTPEPLSFVTKADNLPRMSKLIFRPHPDPTVTGYVIERRTPVVREWEEIATLEGRLNAEYIDIGLEDQKPYEYRIIAVRYDGLRTRPSKVVSITTKTLPETIANIGASNSLPGEIKVTWSQIPGESQLTYTVYAATHMNGAYNPVGTVKNSGEFIYNVVNDGEVAYFKVTATDKDGLESMMQDIPAQGSSKQKPQTPTILKANIVKGVPVIEWSDNDQNVVAFKVIRTKKAGLFSKDGVEFTDIKEKRFKDTSEGFQPNVEFVYQIIAIDKDGVASVPSDEVKLIYEITEESKQ